VMRIRGLRMGNDLHKAELVGHQRPREAQVFATPRSRSTQSTLIWYHMVPQ